MHQAILRAFAATGQAPTLANLRAVLAGSAEAPDAVLDRLHELDVIRLDSARRIAVARPLFFVQQKARSTRAHPFCAQNRPSSIMLSKLKRVGEMRAGEAGMYFAISDPVLDPDLALTGGRLAGMGGTQTDHG